MSTRTDTQRAKEILDQLKERLPLVEQRVWKDMTGDRYYSYIDSRRELDEIKQEIRVLEKYFP